MHIILKLHTLNCISSKLSSPVLISNATREKTCKFCAWFNFLYRLYRRADEEHSFVLPFVRETSPPVPIFSDVWGMSLHLYKCKEYDYYSRVVHFVGERNENLWNFYSSHLPFLPVLGKTLWERKFINIEKNIQQRSPSCHTFHLRGCIHCCDEKNLTTGWVEVVEYTRKENCCDKFPSSGEKKLNKSIVGNFLHALV